MDTGQHEEEQPELAKEFQQPEGDPTVRATPGAAEEQGNSGTVHEAEERVQNTEVSSASQSNGEVKDSEALKRSLSSLAGHLTTKQREAERLVQCGSFVESLPWVRKASDAAEQAYANYLVCFEKLVHSLPSDKLYELQKIYTAHEKKAAHHSTVRDTLSKWISLAEKRVSKSSEAELLRKMDQDQMQDLLESASTTGDINPTVSDNQAFTVTDPGGNAVQVVRQTAAVPMGDFGLTLPHPGRAGPGSHVSQRSRGSFVSYKSKAKSAKSVASKASHCSSKHSVCEMDVIQGELVREQIRLEEMEAMASKWKEKKRLEAEEERLNYEMEIIRLRARQNAFDKLKRQAEVGLEQACSQDAGGWQHDGDDDVFTKPSNTLVTDLHDAQVTASTGTQGTTNDVQHVPNISQPTVQCFPTATHPEPGQGMGISLLSRGPVADQVASHLSWQSQHKPASFPVPPPCSPNIPATAVSGTPASVFLDNNIPNSTPIIGGAVRGIGQGGSCRPASLGQFGHDAAISGQPRGSDPGPECYGKCIELITEHMQKIQLDLSRQVTADISRAVEKSTNKGASPKLNPAVLNPEAPSWKPSCRDGAAGGSASDALGLMHRQIVESNRELASAILLPMSSIDVFSGDPLDYRKFKLQFEARVSDRVTRVADRLKLLENSLSGRARGAVDLVSNADPEQAYVQKWQTLDRKFGQMQLVSNAYINKLSSWKAVAYDDDESLGRLATFMNDIVAVMPEFPDLYLLNYSAHIAELIKKLPSIIQGKWREAVRKAEKAGKTAVFADLAELITEVVEMQSHPLYGRQALKAQKSQIWATTSGHNQTQKGQTVSSSATVNALVADASGERCPGCAGEHDLEDCDDYIVKTVEKRKAFIFEKKLCLKCLQHGHMAKTCKNKRVCDTCSKLHPTSLHFDRPPVTQSANANQASAQTSTQALTEATHADSYNAQACGRNENKRMVAYHAVLPVIISRKGHKEGIMTYAFLDSGSGATFICDSIKEELGITGDKTFLKLKTLHGATVTESSVLSDLVVSDLSHSVSFALPGTFTRPSLGIDTACVPRKEDVAHWPHLRRAADKMCAFMPELSIGLLIGNNCPDIMEPGLVLPAEGTGIFAVQTPLGWTLHGLPASRMSQQEAIVNRVAVSEVERLRELVVNLYESDYVEKQKERHMNEKLMSPEDEAFMKKIEASTTYDGQSYCVGLPFRNDDMCFPNNRAQAEKRACYQSRKMLRNPRYKEEYCGFVSGMLAKGYARALQQHETGLTGEKHWFLPHHGVFHPVKNKIRVVFDCSASIGPVSLNNSLIQGPNLMNTITGVLTKFRLHKTAFVADIESMYHRVKVPISDQRSLKFLWWPDGNLDKPLQEYAMTSHVFGAVSSPAIAIYTLQRTAREHSQNDAVAETIINNFYVDDMLKSCPTVGEAAKLLEQVRRCCANGGFRLTKFSSNSRVLLSTVPETERAESAGKCLIESSDNATERTLGLYWEMSSDTLRFNVRPRSMLFTRRGVLATIASVYDPLGFAAPVVLPAKRLLQELCSPGKTGWDDPLPEEMRAQWQRWLEGLPTLNTLSMQRSFELSGESGQTLELAVCADASSIGHAAVAYLRSCGSGEVGKWHFAMGKARVAPMKAVATIPRLELAAAVTAVQLAQTVEKDVGRKLDIKFYTDSEAVLRYILNERLRLGVYVTNRVRAIRNFSDIHQWWHIQSSDNPADEGSRGLSAAAIVAENKWISGPTSGALERSRNATQFISNRPEIDCQVMEIRVENVGEEKDLTYKLLNYHARWTRLVKVIVCWSKFITWLRLKGRGMITEYTKLLLPVTYKSELDRAEEVAVMLAQRNSFKRDYELLAAGRPVPASSPLSKLSPFMRKGLIRLGGRMRLSELSCEAQNPLIVHGREHVTKLIIRHIHTITGHVGRAHTLAAVRRSYWVIGGLSAVRNVLNPCVVCRKVAGVFLGQKMADLPEPRITASPPFTWVGIDYFGPFIVKNNRKTEKRYGVIFTCLSLRSVHCEMAYSLSTDGFIMAMRRFVARRGHVQAFYSDNGSNFIGAQHELNRSVKDFDQAKIHQELRSKKIEWIFNLPYSSHRGGVWERMIRSVRRILNSLMEEASARLSDESLMTFLCEIESILNSRPLTAVSQDPKDQFPLTPEQILTYKPGGAAAVPGIFTREDLYARKQWRRVQHLAEAFWRRWHVEYLPTLQERGKWHRATRNLCIGDLVMAKDDSLPRGEWPVGVVVDVDAGSDGLVRSATFRTARRNRVERAVQKLILIVACDSK